VKSWNRHTGFLTFWYCFAGFVIIGVLWLITPLGKHFAVGGSEVMELPLTVWFPFEVRQSSPLFGNCTNCHSVVGISWFFNLGTDSQEEKKHNK
jgi:hypothetical protein